MYEKCSNLEVKTFLSYSKNYKPANQIYNPIAESEFLNSNQHNCLKNEEVTVIPKDEVSKELPNLGKHFKRNIGLDIETDGLNSRLDNIVGIGVSDGNFHLYIEVSNEQSKKEFIKRFLENLFKVSNLIICHNAKFEYSFIKCFFNLEIPENKLRDSMVLAYILGKPRKLSTLSEIYLDRYPLSFEDLLRKHKAKTVYEVPLDSIASYCAEDCVETLLLYTDSKLTNDFYEFYGKMNHDSILDIDTENVIPISTIELEGIKLNTEKLYPLMEYCDDLMDMYVDEFNNLSGSKLSINSPSQVSKLLFEDLSLPIEGISKGKSGLYSVDKNTLKELDGTHPIIEVLSNYALVRGVRRYLVSGKDNEKGLSNQIDEKGLIYPNVNNCLTDTGRYSMSNPNLQQSPNPSKYAGIGNKQISILGKKFRDLFICRNELNRFIIADYPSFEFRILAHLSQDETLIKVFNEGLDFHVIVCEKLFNIKYDKKNPLHKVFRQVTKTINYGVAYGMTWVRLQRECLKVGLNYSKEECLKILADYWSVLDGVYAFFIREKLKAVKHGFSETAWGRKRFFEFSEVLDTFSQDCLSTVDIYNENSKTLIELYKEMEKYYKPTKEDESKFRSIQNFPMQGTNADVVRQVTNHIHKKCRNLTNFGGYAQLVLVVHDEFVIESSPGNINELKDFLQITMENSIELCVPLPCKPIVCSTWGEGK